MYKYIVVLCIPSIALFIIINLHFIKKNPRTGLLRNRWEYSETDAHSIKSPSPLPNTPKLTLSVHHNHTQHNRRLLQGSIISFREFTGSIRDTHEPALPAIHTNSFLDSAIVIITSGRMFLYGASVTDESFVRDVLYGSLPQYQNFIYGQVNNFPTVHIETKNETYPACTTMWNVTAVFLSLWHPDNQYHLQSSQKQECGVPCLGMNISAGCTTMNF